MTELSLNNAGIDWQVSECDGNNDSKVWSFDSRTQAMELFRDRYRHYNRDVDNIKVSGVNHSELDVIAHQKTNMYFKPLP